MVTQQHVGCLTADVLLLLARNSELSAPAGHDPDLLVRSEEHTSELQSLRHLVCRLLLEKKNPFPNRDQTLTLSNIGAAKTDAVVTIHPDDGSDPVVRTLSVPGPTVRTFDPGTPALPCRN